jgi:hypothetical protein
MKIFIFPLSGKSLPLQNIINHCSRLSSQRSGNILIKPLKPLIGEASTATIKYNLEISSSAGKPLDEKITGKRINADIFATGGSMDKLTISDV